MDNVGRAMQVFSIVIILIGILFTLNGIKAAINHQTEALMSDACEGE